MLAKGITIQAHKPTNSLFIRHYAADMDRIKVLIREKLDIPLPQVKIEARMEILARNDLFALGVQWGGGGVATGNQATLVGRGFTSQVGQHAGLRRYPGERSRDAAQPEPQRGDPRRRHAAAGELARPVCRPAATSSTCRSAPSCRAWCRPAPPVSPSASSAAV